MIIDIHGHFTTVPEELHDFRKQQLAGDVPKSKIIDQSAQISDDALRASIEGGQIKLQRERGIDLGLFSPIAGAMAHHLGDAEISQYWTIACNNLIDRVCRLYPDSFAPVCQLPQSPGVGMENCITELKRCVNELGFVGCNLNPDPAGGYWTDPPITDRWWYPLYEVMVDLDVPAMIHTSSSCNPQFNHIGAHYINGDTTAFMQFLTADIFKDFPTLRFVIPHGGGAVPYHWGRYRGLAQDMGRPPMSELLNNVFFDTCVYHHAGVELLSRVIPVENVLFASEMIGAVRGIDPETGFHYDDTKRYVDALTHLSDDERGMVFEGNARRVYPRLDARLKARG